MPQFTPPARHDKTVLSVSCQAVWVESRDRLAKSEQPIVLSCWESNSHRRSGRDTDKTVLSRTAWRCELALRYFVWRPTARDSSDLSMPSCDDGTSTQRLCDVKLTPGWCGGGEARPATQQDSLNAQRWNHPQKWWHYQRHPLPRIQLTWMTYNTTRTNRLQFCGLPRRTYRLVL